MEGLLNFIKSPAGQGLIAAVAGGMAGAQRGTPWNNVGRGLLSGIQGYSGALDQEARATQAEQAAEMQALQRQQLEANLTAQQRQQQEAQAKRKAMEQFIAQANPQQNALANPFAGPEGPSIPQVDPFQQQMFRAMEAGIIPPQDFLKATAPRETEIKDYKEIRNPDGSVSIVGLTKDGKVVPTDQSPFIKPEFRDMGGHVSAIDPITLQPTKVGDKTMSAAERDASARGWASNSIASQRLALEQGNAVADAGGPNQVSLTRQFGKAPPNFRWKPDGTAEPIPGGPADLKAGVEGQKSTQRAEAAALSANNVLEAVKGAKDMVGITTAGVGSIAASVPGSGARNLQSRLETIKANLGFDRLQQMRDMSPTGGALGQVAVQELTALQSTVASLDQGQSPAQLRSSLNKIERHYNKWLEAVQKAAGVPQPKNEPAGQSGLPKDIQDILNRY